MVRTQHSANLRDPTTSLSIADYITSSSMVATTEAVESSASAAAAAAISAASITGFDLINHAIRMGSASTSGAPIVSPLVIINEESSSSKVGHSHSRREHQLLLEAHHQHMEHQQQQRGVDLNVSRTTAAVLAAASRATSISSVSSASSTMGHHLGLSHSHASDMAAAAAAQQQHAQYANNLGWASQQLGSGGIVAALQRRHRRTSGLSLSDIQLRQQLRLVPSYLGGAGSDTQQAPATNKGTTEFAQQPPTTSGATTTESQNHHQHLHSQDEQNARQLNPNAFQFPWKLHDMLDRSSSEGNKDAVSWVDKGGAFRVHLPDVFVESVMPRFFKQTKYKSFQRQLNLYGFTRLHNGPNKGGYKHRYFRQGQRTMCQLITRCPIRDSSSSAAAAIAAVVAASEEAMSNNTSENNVIRMVIDEENNNIKKENIDASTMSISSKVSSSSFKNIHQQQQQQQQPSDDMMLSQHKHNQVAALIAAHQQQRIEALTNSFQIMEKARQEQQMQQFQVQQFEAHRFQQLQQQQKQKQREIPLTSSYVPGMPLAGTDHSNPNMASQQISISRTSSISPVLESTKGRIAANFPHNVLDFSNSPSSLPNNEAQHDHAASASVTPTSTKQGLSDSDRLSMFHKEFQFPWKLYEMLEKADEDDFSYIVSWMPGDSCFKVHDADTFVQLVMSRFFKQTKYKSFQRQLNLYGFIRVDTGPNKGGYRHPRFIKGRKDLLALINRIKIKGNGRPRSDRGNNNTAVIIDTDSSGNSNSSRSNASKETKSTCVPATPTTSVESKPETISGITVILEAIKANEGKEITVIKAPTPAAIPSSSNAVHDVADSTCNDSNSTIPSTIDVRMKESSDTKNGCSGLSWRQNPSESFSDWTIEIIEEGKTGLRSVCESVTYHVHRRVLAVGPKKSDYFANIFKTNGSANMTQLRLSKIQAAVFPLALDYIYADIDFDLDAEKAYALYSLGERLENASIVQTVADFYSKCCMTNDNVVGFLKLGQSFQNKTLLDAAILKCSEEIWFMNFESASRIAPELLFRILVIATTEARNRNVSDHDSLKLSQMIAISVSNATKINLTLERFRSLTDKLVLPSLEPISAIKVLAIENTLLLSGSQGGSTLAGDPSLNERCVSSIHENWEVVRKYLSESNELTNTMRSISSTVLFDLLMKSTTSQGSTL